MIHKILFPTDHSPASNAALKYALALAHQTRAMLLVVHVETWAQNGQNGTKEYAGEEDDGESVLRKLLTTAGNGEQHATPVAHEYVRLKGDAAAEIVRAARDKQVDLIVIPLTGRAGTWRVGDVAELVIREAPCPVLRLRRLVEEHDASMFDEESREERTNGRDNNHRHAPPENMDVGDLLRAAVAARASDVHLDPVGDEVEVRFRIDGRLEPYHRFEADAAQALITQMKVHADLDVSDPFHAQEGRLMLEDPIEHLQVRMTKAPVIGGDAVALRLLDDRYLLRSLDTLGLTPGPLARMREMLSHGEGLILVTGPTGSGKTTTALAMVRSADDGHKNIVSIEDPVEYRIPGCRQMNVDLRHGITMTTGLRSLLRMDPDIVVVGEIRDGETAATAMRAASSGRYVFSTLHTRDAASTVTALRDLGVDNRSLGANLTGIISQRLVRRLCTQCRVPANIRDSERQLFSDHGIEAPNVHYQATGCRRCRHRGFFDRVGVFEVVAPNRDIREAIEQNAPEEELRRMFRTVGAASLLTAGLQKAAEGVTTLDEIYSMAWVRAPV